MTHALLAPSAAARLIVCAGSRELVAQFPGEDTPEAADGDAAHWAAAEMLNYRDVDVGLVAPNGVALTDEMVEASTMFARHILWRGGATVGDVEKPLPPSSTIHPQNWGTPDHVQLRKEHLYIDDFKFGHGYVGVYENWQLINYALLYIYAKNLYNKPDLAVTLTIVQPRNYHRDGPIREWTIDVRTLLTYQTALRNAFNAAMVPGSRVNAQDYEICKNCSARHMCEAAMAASWNAVPMAYDSAPLVMSPAAIGLEVRALRKAMGQIAARLDGLEEHAISTIRNGQQIPGLTLAHGNGRTVWDGNTADIIAVADAMGVSIRKDALVTPAQAIKAGLPEAVVQQYVITPRGAAKLEISDATSVARVFN